MTEGVIDERYQHRSISTQTRSRSEMLDSGT